MSLMWRWGCVTDAEDGAWEPLLARDAGGRPDEAKLGKEVGKAEATAFENGGREYLKTKNVTFLGLTL
jgi:hypothetical protein